MLQSRGHGISLCLDSTANSDSSPLGELLSGKLEGLDLLLLRNLLSLLLGDQLNVSRGGHVSVDAAVGTVGAASHLRSLVAVHVSDDGLLDIQALGLIAK